MQNIFYFFNIFSIVHDFLCVALHNYHAICQRVRMRFPQLPSGNNGNFMKSSEQLLILYQSVSGVQRLQPI